MTPTTLFLLIVALKVTVVLSAAALLTLIFRRASAATRHAVWTSGLASALFVLALAFVLPEWKVVPVPRVISEAEQVEAKPARAPEPAAAPITVERERPRPQSAERITLVPTRKAEAPTTTPIQPSPAAPIQRTAPSAPIRLLPTLAVLWLAGFVSVLARYLFNAVRLHRAQKECRVIAFGMFADRMRQLQQHLGIRRPVALVESSFIEVPMTWGVVYPKVLLPRAASEWSSARLNAVLQHELAHVKRYDALTQWLAHLACALYWFHPLVWFAARQMRAERERACDDFVLHAGVPASAYASDLLEIVSSFRSRTEIYPAALAMARRSQFEGRLMALLNPQAKRSSFTRTQFVLTLVCMLVISVPVAAMAARSADYRAALGLSSPEQDQSPSTDLMPAQAQAPAPAAAPAAPARVAPSTSSSNAVLHPAIASAVSGSTYSYSTPAAQSAQPAVAAASAGNSFSYNTDSGAQSVRAPNLPQSARAGLEPDLLSGCTKDKSSSSRNLSEDDGSTRRVTISWKSIDCSLDVRAEGKFTYNADFTNFASIPPGGFVNITADLHDQITKLNIRPGSNGFDYKFSRNGQELSFSDGGQDFLAKFMVSLDRLTAAGVDVRLPKLLRAGGPDRVLAEIEVICSDYARATYMRRLAEQASLNTEQLKNLLALDRSLSSDYEKARVLIAIAGKYDMKDQGVSEAFLNVTHSLSSDYEHARSLLAFFEKGTATADQAHAVLTSVTKMTSDYERSRVLMKLAQLHKFNDSDRQLFVNAAGGMSSDYEKGRTLRTAISTQGTDDQTALAVIQVARKMSSDYEKGQVLRSLAESRALDGQLRDAYLEAARGMSSDYERTRALAAIGAGPTKRTVM